MLNILLDDSSTLNNKDDHINHVYSCTSKKDTHQYSSLTFYLSDSAYWIHHGVTLNTSTLLNSHLAS